MEKLNCILIIDDDEPTNYLTTMLIEEEACTQHLEIADSGSTALKYLQRTTQPGEELQSDCRPDLIFLDINMPCMNGWEFLEHYREIKQPSFRTPVIIMLTTSFSVDDKIKAA